MNIETKNYNITWPGQKMKQIMVSFDGAEQDPVIYHLKTQGIWALDLARASLLYWTEDSVIMDVGGHIGTYSLLAASYTKNKVISIEASPSNFKFLKHNKELNDYDNLEVYNFAAGNEEGVLEFTKDGCGSGGHVLENQEQEGVKVKCIRIDDLLPNLERLDFVKMDIEGYEIEAIRGMENLINKFNPVFLFECNGHTLKFFDKTPNDLLSVLEKEFGYSLFVLNSKLIPVKADDPFPFGVCDIFAVKGEQIEKIKHLIGTAMSKEDRRKVLDHTWAIGNDDIKRYLGWYINKVKFE